MDNYLARYTISSGIKSSGSGDREETQMFLVDDDLARRSAQECLEQLRKREEGVGEVKFGGLYLQIRRSQDFII